MLNLHPIDGDIDFGCQFFSFLSLVQIVINCVLSIFHSNKNIIEFSHWWCLMIWFIISCICGFFQYFSAFCPNIQYIHVNDDDYNHDCSIYDNNIHSVFVVALYSIRIISTRADRRYIFVCVCRISESFYRAKIMFIACK